MKHRKSQVPLVEIKNKEPSFLDGSLYFCSRFCLNMCLNEKTYFHFSLSRNIFTLCYWLMFCQP